MIGSEPFFKKIGFAEKDPFWYARISIGVIAGGKWRFAYTDFLAAPDQLARPARLTVSVTT